MSRWRDSNSWPTHYECDALPTEPHRHHFAVWTGLEPATPCVTGMYSNQLNYHTIFYVLLSFPDCECKGSTFFYTYKSFCCFLIKKSSFWGMSFKNRLVLMVILSYKLPQKRICPILWLIFRLLFLKKSFSWWMSLLISSNLYQNCFPQKKKTRIITSSCLIN